MPGRSSTSTSTQMGWYLQRIRKPPLLTGEEERQLSRRIREHSDPVAREQMIHANLRLVVKICKEYTNSGMTLGDLIAEGNLGLMRAVEEFNPDAGVRFSTYAAWWIKQSVRKAMINAGQPIHIPAYLLKLITKWRRAARQMEATMGRPPTIEEMAKRLKISLEKAEIIRQGLMAVNAPSQMNADNTQALAEVLADKDDLPEQNLLKASNKPFVAKLLAQLEPRERKILELRFALDGYEGPPRTYKEIGEVVGLTRERIRQLEKKALVKLNAVVDEIH